MTSSPEQWLQDVHKSIPQIGQQLRQTSGNVGHGADAIRRAAEAARAEEAAAAKAPSRGGTIQANLTPQQTALLSRKANECLQVLAFMHPSNIMPFEYPKFPLRQMGEYRETAKQLLTLMGTDGADMVGTQLRAELMGSGMRPPSADMQIHEGYHRDLVELLMHFADRGDVSDAVENSLRQAAAGQKHPATKALAVSVEKALDAGLDLPRLMERWSETQDANRRRETEARVHKRIPDAETDELFLAAQTAETTPKIRSHIRNEITKRSQQFQVLQLLQAMDQIPDSEIRRILATELAQRNPTYAEVREQIQGIWRLTRSPEKQVGDYARKHIANAFQRAPISHCLYWLTQGDSDLNQVIWQQVDARIQEADTGRIAGYVEIAMTVLRDKRFDTSSQLAAIELLRRVKRPDIVGDIVDFLPTAPRELWPELGGLLRELTGQSYGPRAGDGLAEVTVAIRQWRQWWEQNQ
jgi:hypothetical protein